METLNQLDIIARSLSPDKQQLALEFVSLLYLEQQDAQPQEQETILSSYTKRKIKSIGKGDVLRIVDIDSKSILEAQEHAADANIITLFSIGGEKARRAEIYKRAAEKRKATIAAKLSGEEAARTSNEQRTNKEKKPV